MLNVTARLAGTAAGGNGGEGRALGRACGPQRIIGGSARCICAAACVRCGDVAGGPTNTGSLCTLARPSVPIGIFRALHAEGTRSASEGGRVGLCRARARAYAREAALGGVPERAREVEGRVGEGGGVLMGVASTREMEGLRDEETGQSRLDGMAQVEWDEWRVCSVREGDAEVEVREGLSRHYRVIVLDTPHDGK